MTLDLNLIGALHQVAADLFAFVSCVETYREQIDGPAAV
jgi:hypothetical protein